MKIIPFYAPTSTYDNEDVERFYENVEAALELHKTPYSLIVCDFSAKGGKKSVGVTAIGNFEIDTRNDRDDMFVGFTEGNDLKMMNTFFYCKASKKWTWKSLYGETNNEI